MQRLGFLIFVIGVIVSSWYAARYVPASSIHGSGANGTITAMDRLDAWGNVAGVPFGVGAVLMVAGGVVARRAMARTARTSASETGEHIADTQTMLRDIDQAIAALPEGDPSQHAEALRRQLDVLLDEMIPAFLDARQRHELRLGSAGYAELSSAFASTERGLARAWSALTDEAWAEVPRCLDTARQSIAQAIGLAGQSDV